MLKHIGTAEKTLVTYVYNDRCQLQSKTFPEITSGNQSYTYNIRTG